MPSDWNLASTDTVGTDDRPQLSSSPLVGADPPLTWHTLNSFIPIFELLGPKFILDQNAYYIHGSLDDTDLAILRDYGSRVTEFILTDGDIENSVPNIAPSTFFHIARYLEPNLGLLPSLLCLRIEVHSDTNLAYLHLLLTPSLKTLEAVNVPDYQHPAFFSFLTTLVHKAPYLEDIILGPGRFPLKSLQAFLKFTYIRQLELKDAASTIDFTFFQDVGALPNLESFILDARTCEYIPKLEEHSETVTPAEDIEVGSRTSPDVDDNGPHGGIDSYIIDPTPATYENDTEVGPCDEDKEVDLPVQPIYDQISDDTNSSTSTLGGFYQLKKFHFVGRLPLIQDIIPFIASSTLEDVSITVIRVSLQDLKQKAHTEAQAGRRIIENEKRQRMEAAETRIRYELMWAQTSEVQRRIAVEREKILEEMERRVKEDEQEAQKSAQATFDFHTALYITVLQTVSSRWSADLKAVRFNQIDPSFQPLSTPPVLPKPVYRTMFCHPKIEILDFKRWKLDSVQDFLFCLRSSAPPNLKCLHLPIDDLDSAVPLSGLLDIAEACPMLESLQCCIILSPIFESSIPKTSLCDFNQLLLVAYHIYLVFPYLQIIVNMQGPNAEEWVRIRDLVKMFQTIREDDIHRFSEAYQRPPV